METQQLEHKPISQKLIFGVIAFATIIIVGIIIVIATSEKKYKLSTSQMHAELLQLEHTVSPQELAEILITKDTINYRFIDLRPASQYIKGHIEGAINISINELFEPQYKNILNQNKQINILYYSDHCGACGPWMLLRQLGYSNNKILLGGYDFVKENVLDNYTLGSAYFNEKAKYDYQKIVNQTVGGNNTVAPAPTQPATPVTPKKSNQSGGGGC